ncbi:MAG: cephalosporin hydroxylase family protein [Negativicutes bacterium]|nr:cephalosporin hydroxylase family protein [Negativicutes bacterium]
MTQTAGITFDLTCGDQKLTLTESNVINLFHILYYSKPLPQGGRIWENTLWMGRQILKCPFDMWMYQELMYRLQPDFVVETGTFMGGSALYLANICDIIGKGEVITIDVEAREGLPVHDRIHYITGSSTDPEVVERVRKSVAGAENVLVILDSDHASHHVLAEMRIWRQFVPVGGYMIVEDSNVNGHPVQSGHGPGPMEAIAEFMSETDEFVIDAGCERFLLTQNPCGYLRRVR